jgi:hypothetical protein
MTNQPEAVHILSIFHCRRYILFLYRGPDAGSAMPVFISGSSKYARGSKRKIKVVGRQADISASVRGCSMRMFVDQRYVRKDRK